MIADSGRTYKSEFEALQLVRGSREDARDQTENEMEREGGRSCLAFTRAGLRYLYGKSKTRGDNVCYAEKE